MLLLRCCCYCCCCCCCCCYWCCCCYCCHWCCCCYCRSLCTQCIPWQRAVHQTPSMHESREGHDQAWCKPQAVLYRFQVRSYDRSAANTSILTFHKYSFTPASLPPLPLPRLSRFFLPAALWRHLQRLAVTRRFLPTPLNSLSVTSRWSVTRFTLWKMRNKNNAAIGLHMEGKW